MYVTIDNILYITVNSTTIHVKRFTRTIMAQLTSIYQAIAQKLIDVFFNYNEVLMASDNCTSVYQQVIASFHEEIVPGLLQFFFERWETFDR